MEKFYTTEDGTRRESTEIEIAEILRLREELIAKEQAKNEALAKKAALLEKLGITEDEAKLLLS